MAQLDISRAVNNILSSRGGTARELVGSMGGTIADLEAPDTGVPVQARRFNPFDLVYVHRAVVMASKLMKIAEEAEGDGLDVAVGTTALLGELVGWTGEVSRDLLGELGRASGLAGILGDDVMTAVSAGAQEIINEVGVDTLNLIGMREHALTLFITHYPPAHEQVKLEPLDQRLPNLVSRAGSDTTPLEKRLSFWREDAQLNDHHGRWHAVNPTGMRPTSEGVTLPTEENRHGELFVYMHEQMIARYDAERLGADLPRVQPFDKYREKMPEGYTPGDKVGIFRDENGQKKFTAYTPRPNDTPLMDLPEPPPPILIKDMEQFRDALRKAAQGGKYPLLNPPPDVSSDNLGNAIEASIASLDWPNKQDPSSPENGKKYGNLHGQGHAQISYFNDPEGTGPGGVMTDLSATVRDPIFWRWHKNVDTIIQIWRDRLGRLDPYDFDDGPPVTVRSEDIIVCREEGLPADLDGEELGAKAFGYSEVATENRWDTDFSSGTATATLSAGKQDEKKVTVTTTDELLTEMRKRTIRPLNTKTAEPEDEIIDYLSHDDFFYFIRLQNHSDQAHEVTVRIFLAPEVWVDDSNAWIEMDRFLHRLEGNEHAVVFRPARMSAVIRKPAIGHEELEGTKPRTPATVWCDCGWPYTLLLPRGTKEGLDFRLLVMLSSNDLTMDDTGEKCTSMSYCGLQDKLYPDKRPMGYPFDRPLPDRIDSIIDKHDNWASRKIKIRCRKL
jgi:hemocyanin-like protein